MLSARQDRLRRPAYAVDILAPDAPVLLHEIGHGVVDAGKIGAGNTGRARRFRAAAIENGVMFGHQLLDRYVDADIDAAMESDALALHLLDAAIDEILLHLEVRNAVAQQPAGLGFALVDMNIMAGPATLLRSEEHTSELQSLMRISYAVFCSKKHTTLNTCTHNAEKT